MHQGRETCVQAHFGCAVQGQKVVVAPHGFRPGLDARLADGLFDLVVIVVDLQRAETEFADVKGFLGELLPAFFAA